MQKDPRNGKLNTLHATASSLRPSLQEGNPTPEKWNQVDGQLINTPFGRGVAARTGFEYFFLFWHRENNSQNRVFHWKKKVKFLNINYFYANYYLINVNRILKNIESNCHLFSKILLTGSSGGLPSKPHQFLAPVIFTFLVVPACPSSVLNFNKRNDWQLWLLRASPCRPVSCDGAGNRIRRCKTRCQSWLGATCQRLLIFIKLSAQQHQGVQGETG